MHLGQVAYEGEARDLLANDDVKRLFLGEILESLQSAGILPMHDAPDHISRAAAIAAVDEAIRSRQSVRAFLPNPVGRTTVEELLRLAEPQRQRQQHSALARQGDCGRRQGPSDASHI